MIILVLNSGSSSIKYKLFDISGKKEKLLDKGLVERIGDHISTHKKALNIILDKFDTNIDAVGHRVVHGGDRFNSSVLIDDEVIKAIEDFKELAPLHNPPSLLTINESKIMLSSVPHAAIFDTAFYQAMPEHAFLYAIPYEFYIKYKIRRYGFHGTSHRYVASQAARILKTGIEKLKIITCHLGSGCSITAIKNAKAIDTSMGFTPLEGLIMGTRSGDIDPSIIPYVMQKEGMDIEKVIGMLNRESGLLGISGLSNDMREIIKESRTNKRAKLALDMFFYRIKKYISAYKGILQDVDAIVFTGGIGENTADLMKSVCKGVIDKKTKVLIIPTDEELMIARDTYSLVCSISAKRGSASGRKV